MLELTVSQTYLLAKTNAASLVESGRESVPVTNVFRRIHCIKCVADSSGSDSPVYSVTLSVVDDAGQYMTLFADKGAAFVGPVLALAPDGSESFLACKRKGINPFLLLPVELNVVHGKSFHPRTARPSLLCTA